MTFVDDRLTGGAAAPLFQHSNPNHTGVTLDVSDWRTRAACAGTDADLWYPPGRRLVSRVKLISDTVPAECAACCNTCPVYVECRDWALHNEFFGVWAGTSEAERRDERRQLGIRLLDDDYGRRDPRLVAAVVAAHAAHDTARTIADRYDLTTRSVWRILADADAAADDHAEGA